MTRHRLDYPQHLDIPPSSTPSAPLNLPWLVVPMLLAYRYWPRVQAKL